ncbi:MAG: flagellar export chaperone FlgN [Phycisphaerales bacterium]
MEARQHTSDRHGSHGTPSRSVAGDVKGVRGARTDAGLSCERSAGGEADPVRLESAIADLESVLHDLIVEHEQLLTLAGAQKAAIRQANPSAMGPIIESQNAIVQRIADLEKRRLTIVATLGERLGLAGNGARVDRPTLAWLAGGLPAGVSDRIARIGARLRELLRRLQQENAALREAASALATHMEAVMRQIAGKLSHAGLYGRQGTVETRVQVMSALDVRS